MCLQRFIGRRGNVRLARSDNGTNFVRASTELDKAFTDVDHQKISQFMQDSGCEWKSTCSQQRGWCVGEANQNCQKDFGIPPKDSWC